MKALTWHGKRDVRIETLPDLRVEDPSDAVIRVTLSGICGSDLHLYEIFQKKEDDCSVNAIRELLAGMRSEAGDATPLLEPGRRPLEHV